MIINEIALMVNNTITSLYSNGITFKEIILALIILNFIVYVITYMVSHFE